MHNKYGTEQSDRIVKNNQENRENRRRCFIQIGQWKRKP